MTPSSTDEHPCPSVDDEFWQSQNIASALTTAVRGGCINRQVFFRKLAY